jgi:hypothetical protein
MINKELVSLLISFLFITVVSAQIEKDSLLMTINLRFGNEPFELEKQYVSNNQDTLQISLVKFYITGIEMEYTDQSSYKEANSYHLIDASEMKSQLIAFPKSLNKETAKIKFNIGVDKAASVSGAMSGDLDPTNAMYWAWQSGYINMKIEGKSKSCSTRNNAFQFHIGGYLPPYYAMRTVEFTVEKSNNINLIVDLATFFKEIHLKETSTIMIPGKKAMELADYSMKLFRIE